ncbi:MAG: ComEC/Rec2 family competence protein [Oligoflexia bacterium]|nr:ComEC/Rec2 family competence protein [Oligoflexia bacterium]
MSLSFIFIILLVRSAFISTDLLLIVEPLSQKIHNFALKPIQASSTNYDWFYSAILFGQDLGLRQKAEIKAFILLGLYHLIVVSGGHLRILENFINKIPLKAGFKKHFTLIFLMLFTLANLLQPACLRSFIQWFFQSYFKKYFYNQFDLILVSIFFCIFLKPSLVFSISMQLSCAATLALYVAQEFHLKTIGKTLLCVLLTAPLLLTLQPCLSLLIFAANIIALPLLEISLLPFSIIMYLFPFLKSECEVILEKFFNLITYIASQDAPQICLSQQRSSKWQILLLFLLYLFSHFLTVYHKRLSLKKLMNSSSGM